MNDLTSRQRKLVYLGAIGILLVPIIWLGMPAGGAQGTADEGLVGRLAQLRHEHDLGESTLGDVDPSSATMNLVLLGMRGIAANALWQNALEQEKMKDWGKMRATVDSIILLQPHFTKVWSYQGWNLAWNVAAVHDHVADRWYWVKEGGKFTRRGTERNTRSPELYSSVGRVVAWKVGQSDEWEFNRKFFQVDPDTEQFDGGPDPGIASVDGEIFTDNYLAARRWYEKGNDANTKYPYERLGMSQLIFRHMPARSQINSARTMQREGKFGERTRAAWEEAHRMWIDEYGRESFRTQEGEIILNATDADVRRIARQERMSEDRKRKAIDGFKDQVAYDYWEVKSRLEREAETQEAHDEVHRAKLMLRDESTRLFPTLVRPTAATVAAVTTVPGFPSSMLFRRFAADGPADAAALSEQERGMLLMLCASPAPLHREALLSQTGLSNESLTKLEDQGLLQTVSEVQISLEAAMAKYERFLARYEIIAQDRDAIEEGLLAVLYWRKIHELNRRPVPSTGYPLERLWKSQADFIPEAQRMFAREMNLAGT